MTDSDALTPGLPAAQLAARLTARLRAVDERVRRAWERLSPAMRNRPRSDGGWSAEQILEHITIANEAYLRTLRTPIDTVSRTAPREAPWRPSLAGRLLARSLTGSFKLPAPGPARPGPSARPEVLHALLATHAAVRDALAATQHADWSSVRITSPLSRLVTMNIGDFFVVLTVHAERHAGQLERLVDEILLDPDVPR
ncbi:MAG: DinB family protein [Gemmatimonadaceae bacterium]|nr:DinB family protein [Gemmatimonadaceae bacterium]